MHSLQGDGAHHRQSHHVTLREEQHSLPRAAWLPMRSVLWDTTSGVRGWNKRRAEEGKPGGHHCPWLWKAFDKVSHTLLVHKLHRYGIGGRLNARIDSFLENRQQAAVVGGERSNFMPVDSGVPQGSVVDPCLFLLYINDLPIDIESKIRLFADDTLCSNTIKYKEDQKKLQKDLDYLTTWEKQWSMSFHPQKCYTLSATWKKEKIVPSYHLHGHNLQNVSTAKYLGVNIQDNLNWGLHIDTITNKANKTLGFLRRNIKIRNKKTKETAYKAFVCPILESKSPTLCIKMGYK